MTKVKVDVDTLTSVVQSLKGISQHIENISDGVKDAKKIVEANDMGTSSVHSVFQGNMDVLTKNCTRVSEDINKHSNQLNQIVMRFRVEENANQKIVHQLDPGNMGL